MIDYNFNNSIFKKNDKEHITKQISKQTHGGLLNDNNVNHFCSGFSNSG